MSVPLTETCVAAPLALDIVWTDGQVVSLHLTWAEGRQASLTTDAGRAMQSALARYVAGQTPDWPELPLCWDGISVFSRRVLSALGQVPRGQKVTYGWLAAQVGSPKSARAVGRVMAGNRFPLLYPCHRVVGADGSLTGFGPGLPMKTYLLDLEGVADTTAAR
ncbi:MAG: methylated-DNA--[protein]-cysteine S-methyltransferase [Desulfovibrionaceae bacterium]|jgi:methylated-DNA-[protein]-cysteine S-methyltransferase